MLVCLLALLCTQDTPGSSRARRSPTVSGTLFSTVPLYQNGSIWYGLEDLSSIPSILSSTRGSQRESTLNPAPPRLSTGNAHDTCGRIRLLPAGPIASCSQSARPCFKVRRERDQGLDCVAPHSIKIQVVAPPERKCFDLDRTWKPTKRKPMCFEFHWQRSQWIHDMT